MSGKLSRYSIAAAMIASAVTLREGPALAFSAASPAKILYVGDSIAAETRDTVKWWTQVTGKAQLTDSVFPGLAICDFLEGKPNAAMPIERRLQAQVRSLKPDLIVLQFWGNPWTDCIKQTASGNDHFTEAYFNQYFWDALNAVQQVSAAAIQAGIPKPRMLWVLQGPDRDFRDRTRRLNESYAFAAGASDRTSDAGFEVSRAAYPYPDGSHDRYEWTRFLPCSSFERQNGYCTNPEAFGGVTELHNANDPVHFCLGNSTNWGLSCGMLSPGIVRYGMRIAHDANAWLGI